MIEAEAIIVGGGPAGSACAWKLKQFGIDCLILDKEKFPRPKLCAGWITPQVMKDLEIEPGNYPCSMMAFDRLNFHIYGLNLTIRTRQYSIRRYEFDNWLIERAGVPLHVHKVEKIIKEDGYYIIDGQFRCRYLVGAGGTFCPVYKSFFEADNPRTESSMVVAMEEEFSYDYQDKNCHLWFFENKLPGYAWYVPKGNGVINVGIGAFQEGLKFRHATIKDHWDVFTRKLDSLSFIKGHDFEPKGYVYYLNRSGRQDRVDNVFVIGDAAGLATRDMGEGIGPAVQSGILAANAIAHKKRFSCRPINKYSLPFPVYYFMRLG